MTAFNESITFSPELRTNDESASYWLRQITIRLRREICWCWHERGLTQNTNFVSTILPPSIDKTSNALNLSKYWEQKNKFFKMDLTAAYLTEQLKTTRPDNKNSIPGSFGWVVENLNLDDTSAFVLALGLIVSFDNAVGSVISACINDSQKTYPNLALAQRIWDRPEEVMRIAFPDHILFRIGLLHHYDDIKKNYFEINWESSFGVPPLVANQILFPNSPLPELLEVISERDSVDTNFTNLIAAKLRSQSNDTLRIIPVRGQRNSDHLGVIRGIAKNANRKVVEFNGDARFLQDFGYLNSIATLCWLKGVDLYLGKDLVSFPVKDNHGLDQCILPLQSIPITIFLGITDQNQLENMPKNILLPVVEVPKLSYHERVEHWKKSLGEKSSGLEDVIIECSRRFRYEKESINRICEGLKNIIPITTNDFVTACRAELELDLKDLAQLVTPRFENEMLILPHKQQLQFQEVITAMKSLTKVHYDWQMAKTWNEGGISVLFAGPSGTGKTMAAEILALELDIPMYRIDLSQVVNKYIGETEKNLKRLFDAADVSEIIIFFDEADALFGRRTEVKDAHDRFANLEINYLLERMERFKGLSILATNRKKDLDDAFMRRIRYVIDFPPPSEEQRKMIWQQVVPKSIDSSNIDFNFLARNFQLTGGNIRSIVLNACLQSAKSSSSIDKLKDELTMEKIIIAIKREYEKSNRSVGIEQFGKYAEIIKGLENN